MGRGGRGGQLAMSAPICTSVAQQAMSTQLGPKVLWGVVLSLTPVGCSIPHLPDGLPAAPPPAESHITLSDLASVYGGGGARGGGLK